VVHLAFTGVFHSQVRSGRDEREPAPPNLGDCSLQVGTECLPQAKELKYLRVLFTSEGKMEREINRYCSSKTGAAPERLGEKRELCHKAMRPK